MLEFYTGVPGSGKTYRAVDHIYNSFLDEKHENYQKYKRFYTNINEFNFSYFNDQEDQDNSNSKSSIIKKPTHKIQNSKLVHLNNDEVANNLDFDLLVNNLEILRQLYLQKVPDNELMQKADELRLSDSFFVIDEAHNYFDSKNNTLIWWLSYHRHLHQDIMLITQSLDLVYRKYLRFAEFYYRAVPSSLRIRGNVFTYNQYLKWQLFKNSKSGTIKVKFNPEVYKLYGSGANTQGKKVIYKFILFAVFFIIVSSLGFFAYSSTKSKDDSNTTTEKIENQSTPFIPVDRSSTFTVVCVGFDCSLLGQNFSLQDFNEYEKTYSLQSVDITMSSDGVYLRSFARNDRFFKEVLNVTSDSSTAR